jgi:hypothetical protein
MQKLLLSFLTIICHSRGVGSGSRRRGPRHGPALAAHEVAHMWFYTLLGNNQARNAQR